VSGGEWGEREREREEKSDKLWIVNLFLMFF
jgi:hypothetical protein